MKVRELIEQLSAMSPVDQELEVIAFNSCEELSIVTGIYPHVYTGALLVSGHGEEWRGEVETARLGGGA